jgi:DNA polymerase-1
LSELHVNDRTALIDADYLAYQAAAWAHSYQASLDELVERLEADLKKWVTGAFCSTSIALWSCDREDNFRRGCYELYKAHRTGTPPAMLEDAKRAVDEIVDRSLRIDHLEADDLIGILATNGKVSNPVMVSVDKDLRQIPGWHFNPNKEDFPVFVREDEALSFFCLQWITGDSTDGFKGLPGVGPAKGRKLLDVYEGGPVLNAVMAYLDKGVSVEDMLAQARCARILRAEDFNPDDRTPILWTPGEGLITACQNAEAG